MSYKDKILNLIKEDSEMMNFSTTTDDLDATVDAVKKSTDSGDETTISVSDDDDVNEAVDGIKTADDAEANADDYEELQNLKNQASEDENDAPTQDAPKDVNEVMGRMSKEKLEKLVEQNKKIGKAYKKIIKVSEIRSKNG